MRWEIWYSQTGCRYGAHALHAGYLRLHTLAQGVLYLLLSYTNNGCMNVCLYIYGLSCILLCIHLMCTHFTVH
jgi:hypothetical protein